MLILAVKFWTVSTPSIFASSGPSPRRLNQWWIAATPWSGGTNGIRIQMRILCFEHVRSSCETAIGYAIAIVLLMFDIVLYCFIWFYHPWHVMDLLESKDFFDYLIAWHVPYCIQYCLTRQPRPTAEPLATLGNQDSKCCGMTDGSADVV